MPCSVKPFLAKYPNISRVPEPGYGRKYPSESAASHRLLTRVLLTEISQHEYSTTPATSSTSRRTPTPPAATTTTPSATAADSSVSTTRSSDAPARTRPTWPVQSTGRWCCRPRRVRSIPTRPRLLSADRGAPGRATRGSGTSAWGASRTSTLTRTRSGGLTLRGAASGE